jgi:hypothetical protein
MLGIQQGRKWGLATLNEFRAFFKLKPYSTFGEGPPRGCSTKSATNNLVSSDSGGELGQISR